MDSIKDVIKNVIGNIAQKNSVFANNIEEAFKSILKKNEAEHCCVSGFKDGDLVIIIDSSTWLYEIKKQQYIILKKLKEKIPSIKSIKFKIGSING